MESTQEKRDGFLIECYGKMMREDEYFVSNTAELTEVTMGRKLKRWNMKICFAVEKDEGLDSQVYAHFHAARLFLFCDMETGSITVLKNEDLDHARGSCSPLKAIGDQFVDAIIVGGIGRPAISELNAKGIRVYASTAPTVSDNLRLAKRGMLPLIAIQDACCGFGPPQGCPNSRDGACSRKEENKLIGYPT